MEDVPACEPVLSISNRTGVITCRCRIETSDVRRVFGKRVDDRVGKRRGRQSPQSAPRRR